MRKCTLREIPRALCRYDPFGSRPVKGWLLAKLALLRRGSGAAPLCVARLTDLRACGNVRADRDGGMIAFNRTRE